MYFFSIPLRFELVVECEMKFFQIDFSFPSRLDFFYRTGSSLIYGLTARFNRPGEDIQAKTNLSDELKGGA